MERKGSGRGGKGKEVKWKRTGEERRRGLKGREEEGKGKRKWETGKRGILCSCDFFRKNPVNLIAFIEFDYAVGTPLNHVVINAVYASNSYTYYY